jgi:hypothetical protein
MKEIDGCLEMTSVCLQSNKEFNKIYDYIQKMIDLAEDRIQKKQLLKNSKNMKCRWTLVLERAKIIKGITNTQKPYNA